MEDVVALADPVAGRADVVVVEGLVPSSEQIYAGRVNLALAKALDADVLLVGAPCRDGDLERIAEAMAMRRRTYRAGEDVRVVGRARQPGARARGARRPALQRRARRAGGIQLVGAVPLRAELS